MMAMGTSGQKTLISNKVADFLDTFVLEIGRYLPLTIANMVWRGLDNQGETILDLGCGRGIAMSVFNRAGGLYAVGVDIHLPNLRECKSRKVYNEVILGTVRALPIKTKSFDIVLCKQLLEHLGKEDGLELVREMERIARNRVIITTPVGAYYPKVSQENPYQEHKSSWLPNELMGLGYKVRGGGVPMVNVIVEKFAPRLPGGAKKLFARFMFISSALFNPVVYFHPKLAGGMVCIKELDLS